MSDGGHEGGGGHKRRGHDEEHEEHENHERWLVSYADMMTLLMVLFIVMFAISQVDQKKFMALKTGLSAGFGAPVAMLSGADALLDVGGAVAPDSINLAGSGGAGQGKDNASTNNQSKAQQQLTEKQIADLVKATAKASVAQEAKNLQAAQKKLQQALIKAGAAKGATFRINERGLVVTLATDKVLFDNGGAALLPGGRRILDALTPTLAALPNKLSIDGHTNNVPIHTAQFPSNWELSADRATGVLRYLSAHIPVARMSASAFGDTHPLKPPTDPTALVVNRRVEIVVLANLDNTAGRALDQLGNEAATTPTPSPSPAASAAANQADPWATAAATPSPSASPSAPTDWTKG